MRIIFEGGEVLDLKNVNKVIAEDEHEAAILTVAVGEKLGFIKKEDIKNE